MEVLHKDIFLMFCVFLDRNIDKVRFLSTNKTNHLLKHKVCFDSDPANYCRIRNLSYIKSIKYIDFGHLLPSFLKEVLFEILPKKVILGYNFLYFPGFIYNFLPTSVEELDLRHCRLIYLKSGDIPFHVKKLFLGYITHGLSENVIHSNITHLKLTKDIIIHKNAIPNTLKEIDKNNYRKI